MTVTISKPTFHCCISTENNPPTFPQELLYHHFLSSSFSFNGSDISEAPQSGMPNAAYWPHSGMSQEALAPISGGALCAES